MGLTPRRLEALAELRRAAEQAGGAVHYTLLAGMLRISKWTAYDLLRELEGLGLVSRRYSHESRGAGRSRILFAPRSLGGDPAASLQDGLRLAFERFSAIGDEAAAATAYLAEPVADLSYHLGYWLSRLQAAGRHATDAAITVLEGAGDPAVKIQTVTALGLGSALARLRASRLAARLNLAANSFNQLLNDVSQRPEPGLDSLVSAARQLAAPS